MQIILQGQWALRTLAESIKLRQEIKKLGFIQNEISTPITIRLLLLNCPNNPR